MTYAYFNQCTCIIRFERIAVKTKCNLLFMARTGHCYPQSVAPHIWRFRLRLLTCLSDYIHYEMLNEIAYPFPKFHCANHWSLEICIKKLHPTFYDQCNYFHSSIKVTPYQQSGSWYLTSKLYIPMSRLFNKTVPALGHSRYEQPESFDGVFARVCPPV